MRVGAKSDTGLVRRLNEDSYSVIVAEGGTPWSFFAVADGMGGHAAGEVASSQTIDYLERFLHVRLPSVISNGEPCDFCTLLEEAIKEINKEVYQKSVSNSEYAGMGTTLTAVLIYHGIGYIGHIGDSRAYLIKENNIEQLTNDHSLVGELVRCGHITEEEALSHPQRNIITRALGTAPDIQVDLAKLHLNECKYLVLCSDGLSNLVRVDEIRKIVLESQNPQEAAEELTKMANARGGNDNITVLVIELSDIFS